jgi:energy-coupling factor transport system permease protein
MLTRIHPVMKLAVCMVWLAAAILVFDASFQLATIAIALVLLVAVERRPPLFVLALMVPFALFGVGMLTTTALFRQEADFAVRMAGETPFGSKAVAAGLVLFLRAVACGMVSAVFVLTTDPAGLVKALMAQCRLPPRVGYALFAAMLLVPDLVAEAQQIRLARAMRSNRPPRRVPLLASAIRRAGRAAISMETRGLAPGAPRTILGAPHLHRRDAVFAVSAMLLLAALVLAA